MEVKELKNDKNELSLKILIPKDLVEGKVKKELASLSQKIKMDGFRVGKVPLSIVERKYGSSVRSETVQKEVDESIDSLIKDRKLKIAGSPKVSGLDYSGDLKFNLDFNLLPEIKLPDFKKLSLEKPVLEISDKELKEEMDKFASLFTEYKEEKKGKADAGDQVTINAVGYVDGEAFDGGKLENYKAVIGSKRLIDTFEDQLIGLKAGDEASVKVTFPKDYHSKDLAGKKAEFKVEAVAVHKAEKPILDDEFAKKFNLKNSEEFKDYISKSIESTFKTPIYLSLKMKLFDYLEKKINFELPKNLFEFEYSNLKKELSESREEEFKDKKPEEIEKHADRIAKRRLGIALILSEYSNAKEIKITGEDLTRAVRAEAMKYPGSEKQIFDFFKNNRDALANLRSSVLEDKAVEKILAEEITLTEKKYKKSDLEKFLNEESDKLSLE